MSQPIRLSGPRTAGNENKQVVKVLAYICMLADHIGAAFFPNVWDLRVIGRMAFPLFAWGLCTGMEYTRNEWKYALRLVMMGVVSQPFFVWGMNHQWTEVNIYGTLLLGLLGMIAIREKRYYSQVWGPILVVLAACAINLNSSYGFKGVMFILLLYCVRKNRGAMIAAMLAFCLYWGNGTRVLTQIFGLELPRSISFLPQTGSLLGDISRIQFWAILALPVIALPLKSRKGVPFLPKWLGYAFYPAHLAVIGVIRHWAEVQAFFSQWL